MYEQPTIVKFLTEVCIQSTDRVSVYECTGEDIDGARWHFYVNHNRRRIPGSSSNWSIGKPYGFARLAQKGIGDR